jgi:hypothetical protein
MQLTGKKNKTTVPAQKDQFIAIQGNIEGKDRVIDIHNLRLLFPGNSELTIDGNLKTSTKLTETLANLDYRTGEISSEQLKMLLAITGKGKEIPDLGTFQINGRISGKVTAPNQYAFQVTSVYGASWLDI